MAASRIFSRQSFYCIIGRFIGLVCILALLAGCNTTTPGVNVAPQSTTRPSNAQTEVIFEVQTPSKLADKQNLFIELLDEVTGLALNATRAQMVSQDQQKFTVKMPFAVGSVVKYRYVRDNDPVGIEYTSQGQQVRYRMTIVDGPETVRDWIGAWKSEPVDPKKLGRIQGQVADKSNNAPIVNALVTAGGEQTLTASDGSFILEGLHGGIHNLVIYALDGSFKAFQQGAVVAAESTTPALVLVNPNKAVKVTFYAIPPKDHAKGIPMRMVGNTYSLGNTFADMAGGVSVLASRAPQMSVLPDGRYAITLQLPVGLDLRYKYSLGDGFWNAEHTASGAPRLRQLIVPNRDFTVEDTIDTWTTPNLAPVSFTVTVPANTPDTDSVSIQFNPFGWTQPLPMWKTGPNQWSYVLYGPLNIFKNASYRYCRNEQCGIADAAETRGTAAKGKSFSPQAAAQSFQDTLTGWAWMDGAAEPIVVAAKINPREKGFQAGVELMTGYRPSWQPYMPQALQSIKDMGSNTVVFTPTWHLTYKTPPVIAPVTGHDPLWFDLTQMSIQAQQKGLDSVYHPVLQYPEGPDAWWQSAPRDAGWWQSWFDRYHTFILYHADLASQTGAKMLIIGDESLLPAWPAGTLADGSASGVPGDAADRWSKLFTDVRARYKGKLAFFIPYAGKLPGTLDFLKDVDLLYVQMVPPLPGSEDPASSDLQARYAAMLDADILPLQQENNQPVLLSFAYPSARGAVEGCNESNGACLSNGALQQPAADLPGVDLDMKAQADAYNALLNIVNERPGIQGFFAAGYYPPLALKDVSVSVRGKPAGDVLWYWFPRLLGMVAQ